jgi:hypothetical protein
MMPGRALFDCDSGSVCSLFRAETPICSVQRVCLGQPDAVRSDTARDETQPQDF